MTPLRVIVLGYVVRGPLGGLAWHHLQYVLGLKDMGHDVYFVEDSDDYPACYNPERDDISTDPSYGLRFARSVFDRIGLGDRWAYYDAHRNRWHGVPGDQIVRLCESADVLLNVSHMNPIRSWLRHTPTRVLIDTDPVFTQVKHLTDPEWRDRARTHNSFFSFAENIGQTGCSVPDDGFPWQPTRQPVVLDAWPVTPAPQNGKFTSVMQWDSYASREYGGRIYGMKSASFQPYLNLPLRVGKIFDLAIGSPTVPRETLSSHGWSVIDPRPQTLDPWTYQRFIQRSRAEFGIAKHGYVTSWSGWFSERSAAYLASGRPVVVQESGFSDWLPTGDGVLPFSSPEEAVDRIAEVNQRYAHHCAAARELVTQYFAAPRVLSRLLSSAVVPEAESRAAGEA